MASPLVADFPLCDCKRSRTFLAGIKYNYSDSSTISFDFVLECFDEYQGWSKDSHTLRVCFNGKTTLLLDQQEEVVDSWKILPLSSSKVNYF